MERERGRLSREKRTVRAMIRIACRGRHGADDVLCEQCQELLSYALDRVDRCPFQADKPTCADCNVHCYRPDMREKIRAVMKYAGPRMLYRHPLLLIGHLVDGLRKPPVSASPGDRGARDG